MKPLQFDSTEESRDSKDMELHLIDNGCLCPSNCDNGIARQEALQLLETIVCDWTRLKHAEKFPGRKSPVVMPALITFGSYCLRVHRLDSDIDVLCLFSSTISRAEFFSSFVEFLEKAEGISKLLSIKHAFTPVVKFYLNGIYIDLLFGNVSQPTKLIDFHQRRKATQWSSADKNEGNPDQEEYKIDDSDLIGMDETGVRSLNGVRVTQFIEENIATNGNFRICLATIKQWAVLNGIYSNMLGFLRGINFAILLAKVCLDNPESETWSPTSLLKLFFKTFALWEWPKPIVLTRTIQRDPPPGVTDMQVWDPTINRRDAMPIITPVYPSMNSSYNVGVPQFRRIQEETIKGAIILEKEECGWKKLLQRSDFFRSHRTTTTDARYLAHTLFRSVHQPFSHFFDQQTKDDDVHAPDEKLCKSFFFIGLRFSPSTEKVNLKHFVAEFLYKINSWDHRKAGMDLQITHVLQSELPDFVVTQAVDGIAGSVTPATATLNDSDVSLAPPSKRPRVSSE
eukprot:scaffold6130_cov131-Cylindrotheca_fusiformis.AAC.4